MRTEASRSIFSMGRRKILVTALFATLLLGGSYGLRSVIMAGATEDAREGPTAEQAADLLDTGAAPQESPGVATNEKDVAKTEDDGDEDGRSLDDGDDDDDDGSTRTRTRTRGADDADTGTDDGNTDGDTDGDTDPDTSDDDTGTGNSGPGGGASE